MNRISFTLAIVLSVSPAFAITNDETAKMTAAIEAVCPLLIQEAGLVQAIAVEKKNPAGVVDLRRLHELGDALAFTRAQIIDARNESRAGLRVFAKWAKKPLDLGFCEAWDEGQDK
jgi:hypothetical protein